MESSGALLEEWILPNINTTRPEKKPTIRAPCFFEKLNTKIKMVIGTTPGNNPVLECTLTEEQ